MNRIALASRPGSREPYILHGMKVFMAAIVLIPVSPFLAFFWGLGWVAEKIGWERDVDE